MTNENPNTTRAKIFGLNTQFTSSARSESGYEEDIHPKAKAANDTKKVILFAGDNGTSHAVLNTLVPDLLTACIEPIVLLTSGTNSPKAKIPEIQDFSFFETGLPRIIYDYLENSDPVLDDNGAPREDIYYSPYQLAKFHGIRVQKIDSVNDPELIAAINNESGVIGSVSIKNYKLFSEPAIEALKADNKFLWNVHTGELPKYRGVFIPVRVMQDENYEYGWTLHDIDNDIDTGDLIDIRTRFLNDEDTALDAYYKMANRGADMVLDNVKLAAKNMARPPIPQNEEQSRYFSFPTRDEIQHLAQQDKPRTFLDERSAVERYFEMFTDENTHPDHARGLRLTIESAIEDYKNGVAPRPRPDLYSLSSDGSNAATPHPH